MRSYKSQAGAVLVVALLMLLILTLLGVASIRSSNINMMLVDNQMRTLEMESIARETTEILLSDLDYFVDATNYDVSGNFIEPAFVSTLEGSRGVNISIDNVECKEEISLPGYSIVVGSSTGSRSNVYWQTEVTVSDATSGATSTFVQGFKFRYLEGYCL